ncbi:MAG: hypothetical protein NVV60_09785 [Luteimonas sp.]|nr:hypothetical protein [Luteimonas sp.]
MHSENARCFRQRFFDSKIVQYQRRIMLTFSRRLTMRFLFAVVLMSMLAACSERQAEPPGSQDATNPAPAAIDCQPCEGALPWHASLPGGVRLDVQAHLSSDEFYETKAGATRRRLVFEFLEAATPAQAESLVTAAFVAAGYAADAPEQGKNGRYSIVYRKTKAANVTATYYPELNKPANPEAKSRVMLTWQTKRAPKVAEAG